jgi:hypothetical protein
MINTLENQKMIPYQTNYEIENKNRYGLSRQDDNFKFWNPENPPIWTDETNFPLTFRKELTKDVFIDRKNKLLVEKGTIKNWRQDIFGNEYGLFKSLVTPPTPVLGENSTYVGFGSSTGADTNEHWLHDFNWTSEYQNLNFNNLKNNSNLLNNATIVGNSIRFTTAVNNQTGNVFYKDLISFSDYNENNINWSCYYVFSMGGGSRADGISFILQSTSNTAGGSGGGLAYDGIQNSIAIGYDSYNNYYDTNNNHIELNVNGSVSNSLIVFTPPFNMCGTSGTDKYIYNWVDYIDGKIKVYCSESNTKPTSPFINYTIDIKNYLKI